MDIASPKTQFFYAGFFGRAKKGQAKNKSRYSRRCTDPYPIKVKEHFYFFFNRLILFLNCEGEHPYCFLKQRLNEVRLLNPQDIAISLI